MTSGRTLSEAVLAAVAHREGVDEQDLRSPLFDAVDPDALDSLFRDTPGRVTFEYSSYTVTVDHEGNVELAGAGSS